MKPLTRLMRLVRYWHARAGVLAAIFFLVLAITGVLLNHTDTLRLDARYLRSTSLSHWYGLRSYVPQSGYSSAHGHAADDGQSCAFNGAIVTGCEAPLVGMVEMEGMFYLATATTIHILDASGRLVEKLVAASLPALPILRVGTVQNKLVIATPQGTYMSADGLQWEASTAASLSWSTPQPLPSDAKDRLRTLFTPRLSLERIILDIHSGRIMGHYGTLFMDTIALILGLLSISGLWIHLRSARKAAPPPAPYTTFCRKPANRAE
jgi:hypothetical protein